MIVPGEEMGGGQENATTESLATADVSIWSLTRQASWTRGRRGQLTMSVDLV